MESLVFKFGISTTHVWIVIHAFKFRFINWHILSLNCICDINVIMINGTDTPVENLSLTLLTTTVMVERIVTQLKS